MAPVITRTRTGCLTCRARRTKCDEQKSTCGNCKRLGLECEWPPIRPHNAGPHVKRKGRATACERCQRDKARCSKGPGTCDRCIQNGLDCHRGADSTPRPHSALHSQDTEYPSLDEVAYLFDEFFKLDLSWPRLVFLHRESLEESLLSCSPPSQIVLAMCALALFVKSATLAGRQRADSWIDTVKKDFVLHKMSAGFSTAALAITLLIKIYDERTGRMGSGPWLWSALATRMAYGLGLNVDVDRDPHRRRGEGEKEIGRRLMWSCVIGDRFAGAGMASFSLCPASTLELQLPRDNACLGVQGIIMPTLEDLNNGRNLDAMVAHGDYFTFFVWFLEIRQQVLAYTKSLSRGSSTLPAPWRVDSPYLHIIQQLEVWRTTLSRKYADLVQDVRLTPLRIWFHQAHCDLYRSAVPGFPESLPPSLMESAPETWINDTRQVCLHHSLQIYEILQECVDAGQEVLPKDPIIIISIYETMRIQLQFISMSQTDILVDLRQTLIRNFNLGLQLVGQLSSLSPVTARYAQIVHQMLIKHGVPINNAEPSEAPAEHTEPGLSQMHHLRIAWPLTAPQDQLPFPETEFTPTPTGSSPELAMGSQYSSGTALDPDNRMGNLFAGDPGIQLPPNLLADMETARNGNIPDYWGDSFVNDLLWNMGEWTASAGVSGTA